MLASSSITACLTVVVSPELEEAQANAASNVETISTAAEAHPEVRPRAWAAAGKPTSVAAVQGVAAAVAEEPGW